MVVIASTLSSKGQTTIPDQFRKELAIKPGHRLLWELSNGKLIATPAGNLMDLAGSLASSKPYLPKSQIRSLVRSKLAARHARGLK